MVLVEAGSGGGAEGEVGHVLTCTIIVAVITSSISLLLSTNTAPYNTPAHNCNKPLYSMISYQSSLVFHTMGVNHDQD